MIPVAEVVGVVDDEPNASTITAEPVVSREQWQFRGDDGWVDYDDAACATLTRTVGATDLVVGGRVYSIDASRTTQTNPVTGYRREIRRRVCDSVAAASEGSSAPTSLSILERQRRVHEIVRGGGVISEKEAIEYSRTLTTEQCTAKNEALQGLHCGSGCCLAWFCLSGNCLCVVLPCLPCLPICASKNTDNVYYNESNDSRWTCTIVDHERGTFAWYHTYYLAGPGTDSAGPDYPGADATFCCTCRKV